VKHPLLTLGVILIGSYVLAITSWNVLEQPFLRLKRFFALRRRATTAAVVSGGDIAGAAPVGQTS
jgi:peptidoglycan/LPS O-acetylase OafA/YrhL